MTTAWRRKAAISLTLLAAAASALWSCAPSAESQKQQAVPANSADVAQFPTGSASPQAVSPAGSSEEITLCTSPSVARDIESRLSGQQVILSAACETGDERSPRQFTFNLHDIAPGLRVRDSRLIDLWHPDLSARQGISYDTADQRRYGSYLYSMHTGRVRCPTIRITPPTENPLPANFIDQGRWTSAFGFLANDDCSLMVIFAGNSAIVVDPRRNFSAHIYDAAITSVEVANAGS